MLSFFYEGVHSDKQKVWYSWNPITNFFYFSGPPQLENQSQLKSLNQLDLSFTKAERNNVCQILDLAPKLVHLVYLGNSANQLACIENNNIQELDLGYTDILTSLGNELLIDWIILKYYYRGSI